MRKVINKITISTFFFISFCTEANALSVDDYIAALIEKHPYFLQLSLSEKASFIDQQTKLSYTDWNITSSVNNINYSDYHQNSYEFSARKNIAKTGGNIALSHSWNFDSTRPGTNIIGLNYSQPLLQNKYGINDRLASDIAAIEVKVQKLKSLESAEIFIASKIKRLIDLAFAEEKQKIYRQQLDLAIEQLEIAEKKLKSGLIDFSDLLNEIDFKSKDEQQWLQSKQELFLLKQELAEQININPSQMTIDFDFYQQQEIVQIDAEVVLPKLRIIQQIQLERKKLARQRQTLENKLLPSINAKIGINSQGVDTSYLDGFSNQDRSWLIGVDFSYPLGQKKASLDIESSEIYLARLNASQVEVEINTRQQIKALRKQIDFLLKMMQFSVEQKQLSEDKLRAEEEKYSNARSQKSWIIASKKTLNIMGLAYAQNAANYQKTIVEYLALIDQLL